MVRFIVFGGLLYAHSASENVSNVCQLLQEVEAHSAEMVRVRGVYHVDSEGSSIFDPDCRGDFKLHDQDWSSAIWLAYPGSPTRLRERVTLDQRAFDRLVEVRVESESKGGMVRAVFEGRLEYCPEQARTRTGRTLWVGCGHMGKYPLQLVVKTVRDIVMIPKKKPDSR